MKKKTKICMLLRNDGSLFIHFYNDRYSSVGYYVFYFSKNFPIKDKENV